MAAEVTPPQQYLGYTGYKGIYGSYTQPYTPGNVFEYLELVEQLVQQQGSVGVNAGSVTFTPGVYNSGSVGFPSGVAGSGGFTSFITSACPGGCRRKLQSGAFTSGSGAITSACPECPRNLRFVQASPLRRGNLLQILDEPGDGDLTFFAPTNTAFRRESVDLLELLFLQDEFIPHLADLLLYHGIDGKRLTEDFQSRSQDVDAFNNETVRVTRIPLPQGPLRLRINQNTIKLPDISASNGVTHVINGLLKPDWVTNSIFVWVTTDATFGDLSKLVELLVRADLADTLDTFGDKLTVVGPTNDAFDALDEALLESWGDPANQQDLVDVLEYHIIKEVLTPDELVDGDILETRHDPSSVEVSVVGTTIQFNQANVVSSDSILANNGVLYRIDSVLNPNSLGGF
jgi:uncharacterized surface protein with fasciclin (FAS1) repeats